MTRRSTALAAAALAVALASCGGKAKPSDGQLSWDGKPTVFKAKGLPNDRVVIARVKNTGSKTLHLIGAKLVAHDANGRALDTTAAFTNTFAHGLYGALEQPPGGPPVQELARLGKTIYLAPGDSAPFYAAWRLDARTREPVTISYGSGTLAVPEATATSH